MAEARTLKPPAALVEWPMPENPQKIWVGLREVYQENLSHVEILTWPLPEGLERDRYIVRGLPLEPFLRKVLQGWSLAERQVFAFKPLQRLPQPLLDVLPRLSGKELAAAFDKLREQGLLPPMRTLSRKTWPRDMPWDSARYCYVEWPI
jgi:hypothetical protein